MKPRYFDLNIEKILEGWDIRHAVRELIANALDEEVLSGTRKIRITRDPTGTYHLRDFGRGLRHEHLTQNENKEKQANSTLVIGKFGVGLKDALATLNRRGIKISIVSRHAEISIRAVPKHGFADIRTLHAVVSPSHDPSFVGTEITLHGIPEEEMKAAKSFFLRFTTESELDSTPYGQILKRRAGQPARIYVTGLLVAEEEKFLFSYNITSLTSAMRKALNRERTNVGRTAYSDRIKSMLLGSTSPDVASPLAADLSLIERGEHHDEVHWIDVATHACQILNAQRKVVFVTARELSASYDSVDRATSEGYELITIPENIQRAIAGSTDVEGNVMRDLVAVHREWEKSFEFVFIPPELLTPAERLVFNEWRRIAKLGGGLPQAFTKLLISETMRVDYAIGDQTLGLWDPGNGQVIIRRSELASLSRFAGTFLHELTHARTGFPDVSRSFESALTEVIGTVIASRTQ